MLSLFACEADLVGTGGDSAAFRSLTSVEIIDPVHNQSVQGEVCVTVDYACDETATVSLEIDAAAIFEWQRSPGASVLGDDEVPPAVLCFNANRLNNGSHPLLVTETCKDLTSTSDAINVSTSTTGMFIHAAIADDSEYQIGDTVELELHAGRTGLTVLPDFSALDSDLRAASPTVVDLLDGRYLVHYTISTRNVREAGQYPIKITILDTTIGSRVYDEVTRVTYVPNGRGRVVAAADGRRLLEATPHAGSGSGVPVLDQSSLALTAAVPPGSFGHRLARGEEFTLSGRFSAPDDRLPAGLVYVLLTEAGRDGHEQVIAPVVSSNCFAGTCDFDFSVDLQIDLESTLGTVNWSVGVWLPDHGADSVSPLVPGPGLIVRAPSPPAGGKREVFGHVSFAYFRQGVDTIEGFPAHPQWGQGYRLPLSIRRARHVRVNLADGCGAVHSGWTDANGNFLFQYETACPNSEATVTVESLSEKGALDVEVRSSQAALYSVDVGAFVPSAQPDSFELDTTVIAKPIGVIPQDYVPVGGAPFNLLDYAIVAQLWTRYTILGPTPYNGAKMPELVVWYERDDALHHTSYTCAAADVGNYNVCALGAGVYIVSDIDGVDNRDEWELTTLLHEFVHYLGIHFMVNDPISDVWNGDKPRWMFAFDEGIAYGMSSALTGKPWDVRESGPDHSPGIDAENYDFNGVRKRADDTNEWTSVQAHMPLIGDYSSGWVARIIWDIADPTGVDEPEPATRFSDCDLVMGTDNKWENCTPEVDYGNFDVIDGKYATIVADSLFNYMGGELLPANPALGDITSNGRGPAVEIGGVLVYGSDLFDLLDGLMCRSQATQAELTPLINQAMDFQYQYDGPANCP